MNNKKRTVITGIGPIASSGIGQKDFWQGLLSRRLNLKEVDCKLNNRIWQKFKKHHVLNFNINKFGLNQSILQGIKKWKDEPSDDVDLNYLIAAAKLAIDDSALSFNPDKNNISLIATHENPGLEQYFNKFLSNSFKHLTGRGHKNRRIGYHNFMVEKMMKSSFELQTFMPLHHISKILGLHGFSSFVNNACASGSYALEQAKNIIESGHSDVVVITGADCPDVYKYLWFKQLNMYAENGISRPFCSNSRGFVMGDGATGLVLESLDHALRRSAFIYAEYLGGGFQSEGWKVTLPDLANNYYLKTMKIALERSRITKEEIDLLIPHGVGTPLSDKFELFTMDRIFDKRKVLFTALKPYFGHNLGGGVLLEVAAMMLMFKHRVVLPTLNLDHETLPSNINILKSFKKSNFKIAMKSTCAFAGFDSTVIFKRIN
jgi:3-oxoacyl-[acyl-carrier-protein] synthase II